MCLGSVPGEDTTFARLRLDQFSPFSEEGFDVRLLGIDSLVVSQCTLGVPLPPLARLGMSHPVVRQVRQADHGRPADAPDNDNVPDLAHDIVTFDAVQPTTGSLPKDVDGEPEQIDQWLRA